MLQPAAGMYRYFPGEVDLVLMHRMASGFPIDRDTHQCLEALEALHAAGAWDRIGRALQRAVDVQVAATPGITVPNITVLIIIGDPADQYFMCPSLGMSANGSVPGCLYLNFWPTSENLARLEATAVHELNHNPRTRQEPWCGTRPSSRSASRSSPKAWPTHSPRQLYGKQLGYTRMGVPHLHDDAVFAKVMTGLDVTGMQNFAAGVHGDDAATRFGTTPVGLPTGARYAVGNRLVDAYLATTGRTAAQALLASSDDIITTALGQAP